MAVFAKATLFSLSFILLAAHPSSADELSDSTQHGRLTIDFRYTGEMVGRKEFKDRTTFDQTARIECPVSRGDVTSASSIVPPTSKQAQAMDKMAEAAKKELSSVPPSTVSKMKSLDAQMKACKASGKSEQVCGMQIMMAMQSDPDLTGGREGASGSPERMAAEQALAEAEESIQPWFNEGCTGTMTVNNSFQLDDPTIPGPEPIIRTTGTAHIDTRDTLVTVETDLKKKETRYLIIPPEGRFRRDASYNEEPTMETLAAIPANPVIAGPFPGPLQSGRFEKTLQGGKYTIEWSFRAEK